MPEGARGPKGNRWETSFVMRYEAENLPAVRQGQVALRDYNVQKTETIQNEQRYSGAVQESTTQTRNFDVATKGNMRTVHRANMAVLGLNMSLLGLSWNLQRSGMFSEETARKITEVVAPIQMVASVINFAASAYQLFMMWQEISTMAYVKGTVKVTQANGLLSSSFKGLFVNISMVMAAMGGLAAIFGAFITNSWPARAALSVLGAAMITYAVKTWAATTANLAFTASWGPAGWIAAGATLAVITFILASVASMMRTTGLWRGGIAMGRTNATIGELGPEAVIPLRSPSGRRLLDGGGGGAGVSIERATFNVRADRPATLYRETNNSVRRQAFLR